MMRTGSLETRRNPFMHYLRQLLASRRRVMALAIVGLIVLAYVDWITGPSVSVTCFYLIPVFLLSWYGGRWVGMIVAVCHAVVWLGLDVQWLPNHSPSILAWNFVVRFITFASVVWLVYLCRNLTGEVERLIVEKNQSLQREVATRAANEEEVRQLASQLSVAEDAERRRLGHELHDSLGQSLSLLKLQLEAIAARGDPELGHSLETLSSVIQQARTLTFELYPSMLDQLGLGATLEHYGRQLALHLEAAIHVSDSGPAVVVPVPLNCFLFRAVKELINNSLKHGKAGEIVVQIRRSPGELRVAVSDDGRGFHSDKTGGGPGLGLPWIRERVRCFGGTIAIETAPGGGASGGGGERVLRVLPVEAPVASPASEALELLGREPYGEFATG